MIKYNLLVFAVMSWLVCLASCNTNLNLEDGIYYFETKPSLWTDKQLPATNRPDSSRDDAFLSVLEKKILLIYTIPE